MRRGELEARRRLVEATLQVILADLNQVVITKGIDTSTQDKAMFDAAKDYVNTVVGPNMGGDRC